MRFVFSEDQLLFQGAVRDFLAKECPPERVRELWQDESGRSPALWAELAALGVPGLLVPEAQGGLGLDEVAAALLHEELGRAAVPGPLLDTAAVAVPLLAALEAWSAAGPWLEKIAAGEARVAVGHELSPFVADAHVAGLLLLQRGDEVHAVEPGAVEAVAEPVNDPGRRLFSLRWTPSDASPVAGGAAGRALWAAALDRGALASAAQALGAAEQLLELAAAYAQQRVQFGKPIGSFQAVKHQLADVKVRLEYARPLVHRAAWSVARQDARRALHVSMAKCAACGAAARAARSALQVHGAIGYTWEQDLHIWMRRAWSLEQSWGRSAFHRARIESAVLDPSTPLGPSTTF